MNSSQNVDFVASRKQLEGRNDRRSNYYLLQFSFTSWYLSTRLWRAVQL